MKPPLIQVGKVHTLNLNDNLLTLSVAPPLEVNSGEYVIMTRPDWINIHLTLQICSGTLTKDLQQLDSGVSKAEVIRMITEILDRLKP